MTKVVALLFFTLTIVNHTFGQNVSINSTGALPDTSAVLDVSSTSQGLLIPRMTEAQRNGIVDPATSLMVYQTDDTTGFYYYDGTAWEVLGGVSAVTNISNVTSVASSGIAIIRDEKPSSTDGGTFTSGAWRQRDLNTIAGDTSFVSLDTNHFTLDSGIYVITADAPAYYVERHQARLYNSTLNSTAAVGMMEYCGDANASSTSRLYTVVSVGAGGESFTIQHRCQQSNANDGFGRGPSWGAGVFTQVRIDKL